MAQKKKVLMVAHVASMIKLFNMDNIEILKDMNYQVDVCCNFENGSVISEEKVQQFKKQLTEMGITYYQIPFPRKVTSISEIAKSYKLIKKIIQDNEYELIHCQAPISGVITRLAARKRNQEKTKLIYAVHGFHFFKGSPLKNWILYYPVERYCARYADRIITINKEDYDRACKFYHGKKERVRLIHGVGVETFQYGQDVDTEYLYKELNITKDSKIVVTVGELTKGKNYVTGLEAFARIPDNHLYYVICGIGKYEQELKLLARKLGIEQRVKFLGYRSDIAIVDNMADVFLFPSLREGLPVCVMEAMAAGKPVVCSNIRGNRDLIDDKQGGFLINKTSVIDYTSALEYILQNPEKAKKMGDYNRKKMREYDISVVHHEMEHIYRELIKIKGE